MPKQGDTRPEDGKVFWSRQASCLNGERWITPEQFKAKKEAVKRCHKTDSYRGKQKLRRNTEAERGKRNIYAKKWRKSPEVRARIAAYMRLRRREDAVFNMQGRVRARMKDALRYAQATKKTSTLRILGCSWEEFNNHIESKFLPGMTWHNRSLWHIDHRLPLSLARTEQEAIQLCHFSNLQPLWAVDNHRKGSRLPNT